MTSPRPGWMNSWSAAGVCGLFAAAVGWLLFDDLSSHYHLQQDGQPSTVQIVDRAYYHVPRGHDRYWLRVRSRPPWVVNPPAFEGPYGAFRTVDPAPGEQDIEVADWEYDLATAGGSLKVLYLPDVTDQPIPSSTLSTWQPPLVGFILFITLLVLALSLANDGWQARRKARSA